MDAARIADRNRWPAGVGWLTASLVAAVVAINVAGIGAIALVRRGVVEEAGRSLRLETSVRARSIESILASARADLAFLTGSPTFFGLEAALASRDPREVRWRRLEAEGALLLFLRGHSEVTHLLARSATGRPLVEAGRRGGVPVLWVSGGRHDTGTHPRVTGLFAFASGVRRVSGAVTLEVSLDPAALLAPRPAVEEAAPGCALLDGGGTLLAGQPLPFQAGRGAAGDREGAPTKDDGLTAEATIATEGWSAPSPWRLACSRRRSVALAPIEPVAARYRSTLALNLVVMSLAILLGALALQETRRRRSLEATAREETRVRELERQLFHAERLSTVGRLAAGMAHEINNPMEGMSNYLSLAMDDLARGDVASVRRRLDGVGEGLRRAIGIVRQVLAHADPAKAPRSPLDLNTALRQTAEFVQTRPEFRNIRFELDLAAGELAVLGSSTLLGQVFLNLVLNGCEAQPQGGEIRMRTFREGARAVAEIADRGPGVPKDDSARIFEPFYSTKQSTGLGLSICYAIVSQHGGELRVASREGGGAVFALLLPAAEAAHV